MQQLQLHESEFRWIAWIPDYLDLTSLAPSLFTFIVFVFISLGLIMNLNSNVKCACKQSKADFLYPDVLNHLDAYKIKYSPEINKQVVHNLNPDTVCVFLRWHFRADSKIQAKLKIFPSQDMYNKGIVENALLTNLPGPGDYLNNYVKNFISGFYPPTNWYISSPLTIVNRVSLVYLYFYTKHLFTNRFNPNWLIEEIKNPEFGYIYKSDVMDLRGCVFSKVKENLLSLDTYKQNTYIDMIYQYH